MHRTFDLPSTNFLVSSLLLSFRAADVAEPEPRALARDATRCCELLWVGRDKSTGVDAGFVVFLPRCTKLSLVSNNKQA